MDTYQAVYDAVRSKISGGDISGAVERALFRCFDISHQKAIICDQLMSFAYTMDRPSRTMRPRIFMDGNQWCALYGEDPMTGVAGFGDSPEDAMWAFDKAWGAKLSERPQRSAS